nr:MAG TPA: hypothetical protein [Caudoviricetes sp.]
MIMLTIVTVTSVYVGIVMSIIFRLNQSRVLEGRVKIALVLPFLHFLIIPVLFMVFCKEKNLLARFYIAWQMVLIFPQVLAIFSARLALRQKKQRLCIGDENKNEQEDVTMYRETYNDVSQKLVFA